MTPAYVADIEAGRRLPSAELRARLAAALEIPIDDLAAADARLTPELRDWIDERPDLIGLLRSLRSTPESDRLIGRLSRLIGRRSKSQGPRGFLVIWESELRAIAAEALAWSIETGGDLFGRWHDLPTILLATKAGPAAQRNHAHFRLDVDYLRQLSETMASDWALRYFGDWHSHHRLGLSGPSGGDRKRILNIAGRNQFTHMTEIIVTLDDRRGEPLVRIHPWIYDLASGEDAAVPLRAKILPGVSPVRHALLARKTLPEQNLLVWEKIPLERIRLGLDATPPTVEPASDVDSTTRERTFAQLAEALQNASGSAVEDYTTGFGRILVAKLEEPYYLGLALGSTWPMPILEVHRINRADGSTEAIEVPANLIALDVPGILEVFARARGPGHVDA